MRFTIGTLLTLALVSTASAVGQINFTGVPGSPILNYSLSGTFNVDVFGTGTITRSELTFVNADFVALSPSYSPTTSVASGGGSLSVNSVGGSPLTTISLKSDGGGGDDLTLKFDPGFQLQGDINTVSFAGSGTIDISPNVFGADVFIGSGAFTGFIVGGGPGGVGGGVPGAGPFTFTITGIPEPATASMALIGVGLFCCRSNRKR